MNNGNSSLIRSLNANILASIVFFLGAFAALLIGFSSWLSVIIFALAVIVFFIEGNGFVRNACAISAVLLAALGILKLILKGVFRVKFFSLVYWIIGVLVIAFLIYCALCALNGKKVSLPIIGSFINGFIE